MVAKDVALINEMARFSLHEGMEAVVVSKAETMIVRGVIDIFFQVTDEIPA